MAALTGQPPGHSITSWVLCSALSSICLSLISAQTIVSRILTGLLLLLLPPAHSPLLTEQSFLADYLEQPYLGLHPQVCLINPSLFLTSLLATLPLFLSTVLKFFLPPSFFFCIGRSLGRYWHFWLGKESRREERPGGERVQYYIQASIFQNSFRFI